jgi:signal transduction histidine kinase
MTDSFPTIPTDAPPADVRAASGETRRGVSAYAVFATPHAPSGRAPRRVGLPELMLVGTLLLTLGASSFVHWSLHAADTARFDNAVQSAEDRVNRRIETYVALLHGTRGLFAASGAVDASEFRAYVDRLELPQHYPGIQGIGYSRWLNPPGAPSDRPSLLAALRAGGSFAPRLWPDTTRPEYHAVVYLEPLDRRNRAALGFDMHTDPTRRAAMERARDQGVAAASGAVTLKQEIEDDVQKGFLVYLAVYAGGTTPATVDERRARLRGFVYAPFRAGDLFRGIFGSETDPRVAFRVYDAADTVPASLIHAAAGAPEPGLMRRATHTAVRPVWVAGHRWTIVFTPRTGVTDDLFAALAVGSVALFGTLLAALLYRVTRSEVRARRAAERSDALRSRFFAAMSHELRTPVNAVLGYNDLLLAGVYGPLAEAQEHGIQRSQRAARHLLELVNDVLDLSKLEAGKMDIVVERVPLDEFLEDLLVTIRPMAEERGCELRLDAGACHEVIETDPRRLRQILLNLLSNATKFGAGGPVVVSCAGLPHGAPLPGSSPASVRRRRRTAGDAVVISVTDHGPGIARADQERIFEEFVQLPGTVPGGTGLGLPISRRLSELLGGYLTVDSALGRGSTFRVTVPCRRPH